MAEQRRGSIMDAPMPPSEYMAGQDPTALPGAPPSSRPRGRTNSTAAPDENFTEMQNERAIQVLNRVKEKLTGRDFKPEEELSYISQVDKLLIEATKLENLCQHYIGWCSFW
jgi:FKBP12-rapamycin complex-associated protein